VNECAGPAEFAERFLIPLRTALTPLTRRDDLVMAGVSNPPGKGEWVSLMGHYVGNFTRPLFGIKPHDRLAFVRYGEFYRIEDGKIADARLLVDFLDLARQAGQMRLPPELGTEMLFPAPATHDGVMLHDNDPAAGKASVGLVEAMLKDLRVFKPGSFESAGQTGKGGYWHEHMLWYGPAGIGSNYTYPGFQKDHRASFLTAFPDRVGGNHYARFGDGAYVCSGGWPSIHATHGGDYLGVKATGRKITQRVMDFWRCADGQIMENWVFIDMPDLFLQMGVDLLPQNAG
jgi:predicted ester cyclase